MPRPQLTPIGRIIELERRADGHDVALQALGPMETQLKEIHDMLVAGRAILWFVRGIATWTAKWVGGPGAIAGLGYAAWRAFTGH